MRRLALFISLLLFARTVSGQLPAPPASKQQSVDKLKHELQETSNDTLKLVLLNQLRYCYFFERGNLDSALYYSMQFLPLTQKLNYKIDEAYAHDLIADIMTFQHNPQTLETFFKGIKIAEDAGAEKNILPAKYLEMMTYWHPDFTSLLIKKKWAPRYFRQAILASLYQDLGRAYGKIMPNQQRLFFYLSRAIEIYKIQEDTLSIGFCYINIADYFRSTNQLDSCLVYAQKGYDLYHTYSGAEQGEEAYALSVIGTIHFKKGNYSLAINELMQADSIGLKYQQGGNWLSAFTLSEYFYEKKEYDSSIYYSTKSLNLANRLDLPQETQQSAAMLASSYERKGINDSAVKYFSLSVALNDSLNNAANIRKLQGQDFDEQIHRQELEDEKNKLKLYFLFGGIAALLIIAGILLRNNMLRKRTNIALHEKNEQVIKTLGELKSTQAQLIQSEKMASLGELTAGIAHEIQNPLNFVNNFSDVNTELIDEAGHEIEKGNIEDVKAILADIKDNEQKINHHGKRADAIVKGMLQHSRASSGRKELTDINDLADEYLRLSYHGIRAKDNSFNATMKTDFDESIGKINIIPQDIGRVLLNLYNNAFYAAPLPPEGGVREPDGIHIPTVWLSTKKVGNKVLISVKDNGPGIPSNIVDKIFQPFFTTKPTGQGTGLGLSLSYDIVKAHGGEISVHSEEGVGTEFTIMLPL